MSVQKPVDIWLSEEVRVVERETEEKVEELEKQLRQINGVESLKHLITMFASS